MSGLRLLTQSICFQLPRLTLLDNINDALVVHRCWVSPLSATAIQMTQQIIGCKQIRTVALLSDNVLSKTEKNQRASHWIQMILYEQQTLNSNVKQNVRPVKYIKYASKDTWTTLFLGTFRHITSTNTQPQQTPCNMSFILSYLVLLLYGGTHILWRLPLLVTEP